MTRYQLEGSDAGCYIQWKGTDLCMDLHCPCGEHSHVDEDFVYAVRCPGCGAIYELGEQVVLKRNDAYGGSVKDARDDDGYDWETRESIRTAQGQRESNGTGPDNTN